MTFDSLNEYCANNPPEMILDDQCVRHINEVPYSAEYELNTCDCGIVHPVGSDTWYHAGLKKECRMLLMRKLVRNA